MFEGPPQLYTIKENERKFYDLEHKDAYLMKMKVDAEKVSPLPHLLTSLLQDYSKEGGDSPSSFGKFSNHFFTQFIWRITNGI